MSRGLDKIGCHRSSAVKSLTSSKRATCCAILSLTSTGSPVFLTMATLNGEAEVLSATCPVNQENVATGGRGSSVIESLQTFWSCPLPEDGLERPHKRRRLNEDNDISIRAEVARQPYVTLAQITLDLVR